MDHNRNYVERNVMDQNRNHVERNEVEPNQVQMDQNEDEIDYDSEATENEEFYSNINPLEDLINGAVERFSVHPIEENQDENEQDLERNEQEYIVIDLTESEDEQDVDSDSDEISFFDWYGPDDTINDPDYDPNEDE